MDGIVKIKEEKKFESELTDTLAEHYLKTGKTFFWASVAKEDGLLPYDFALQVRRAEMHGELYIKKIAGDWKICLTKQTIKQVGHIDRATIFRGVCVEEGKEKPRPTRLSRTSMKILFALAQEPQTSVELASGLKRPVKDVCSRLRILERCHYIKRDLVYWRNTSIGEFVANNPPEGVLERNGRHIIHSKGLI